MYFRSPKVPKGVVWVCVLLKVHLFVSTLAKQKLHCAQRARSNLKRGEASHNCTYGASSLAEGNHHEAKSLITERAALLLTRLRSKHIESIPPAVGCSISRSIPPLAYMLHIENPKGIYIDAPEAPIPLSPLWQSQNFTCALHELHCVATSLLREQKFAKAKTSLAKRRISQDNGNEQKFPPP